MGKFKMLTVDRARLIREDYAKLVARTRQVDADEAELLLFWWNDGERTELISGAVGIYQGKEFGQIIWNPLAKIEGVDEEDLAILRKGPPGGLFSEDDIEDDDLYWEVWCNVIDNWNATDEDGRVWHLENNEGDGSLDMVSDLYISDEEVEQAEI